MRVGREPVVKAGLKLLDAGGLEALTLRAIAAELGVKAPTLYWRFKNKQDLVDEMATQVLIDWAALANGRPSPASWQAWAQAYGADLRRTLLRYRDGARMVAGSRLTDTRLYAPMERALEYFQSNGIAPPDATLCMSTIYSYVIGFTIEQQAVLSPAGKRDPRFALSERDARIDVERYPLARSIGVEVFDNYDARFERGLQMVIAGFAAQLARPA